jgi:hypothetical protein
MVLPLYLQMSPAEWQKNENTLESSIYKNIFEELSNKETQNEITKEFPKPEIHRRNTGYAVDILLKSELFDGTEPTINLETAVVAKGHWHSQLKLH